MNAAVRFICITLAGIALGHATAEAADSNPVMDDRFTFYLGGFFPEVNTEVRINGEQIDGDLIDFENDFGIDDSKNVIWGGVGWRISRRNSLEFEFANLDREGSVTWQSDPIQVGDSLVQAGASIESEFDLTLGRLTYGFSAIRTDKHELQVKAGLHIADASASTRLSGAVCVDNETPPCDISAETPRLEAEDVTAPLPHLGIQYSYAFSPKLMVRLQAIGFSLELDDIEGSLYEVDADVVWNPWQHFGFGAGVRYFNMNVESTSSDLNGEFDFEYYGPVIYAITSF